MTQFSFDSYDFDSITGKAMFRYKTTNPSYVYIETVDLQLGKDYDAIAFERALFLAFMLIGISYYKSFPSPTIHCNVALDDWQAMFFTMVYQEGLSQFAFENNLTRDDLAHFIATSQTAPSPSATYAGEGIMTLQSGGKDSLLVAQLLEAGSKDFTALYITSSSFYPRMIDELGDSLRIINRTIDISMIRQALGEGGKNGHVPVTYIVLALGLLQTILDDKNMLLASIGHEGEEPHAWIDDLPVNHQWSKTWQAEELFAQYVQRYVAPNITVGSVLRGYSELKVAELFANRCWHRFGNSFSSCNQANYQQGADNSQLSWCGNCPKCANSYLLFAPFVSSDELQALFDGDDLFTKDSLTDTFKGLLGVDDIMKPFECVGEIDELRRAYHLAREREGFAALPFDVPASGFDYNANYPRQSFTDDLVAMIQ